MSEAIVVINAGSTSVKFAAYAIDGQRPLALIAHGKVGDMEANPQFTAKNVTGKQLGAHQFGKGHGIDHKTALHFVITWLEKNIAGMKVAAAGHRIVLGGTRFEAPVLIDPDVLTYLESLVVMEPSHQPYNVGGARALAEAFPGLPQVACFDTSFHRTMPEVAQIYALPKEVQDDGARHWGYHGISYDYISRRLPKYAPEARRVIVAHLGGGASMCAMLGGKSIETTMGFGGLTGLPMATRSGDVPQDLLFYLLRRKLFDDASLEKMLYERSGLLGLSSISDDMRVLQKSDDPRAAAAIAFFVYAMTKYVGAYTCVLGGLDALVFTAGIGENSAPVRAGLCHALGWLGVTLDAAANADNGPRISTVDSPVSVWVIPTDEELMIAQHTLALVHPDATGHQS
ncbi:MAG TPA: acetate/propionate family kinase [Methylovirgula sp.]